jgi:alpha-glucan,water dikinase
VLSLDQNRETAQRYDGLTKSLNENFDGGTAGKLREAVQSLSGPEDLKNALREAFANAHMAWPQNWESAWQCIKHVWGSKWNERAVLSRKRMGLRHEDLFMAVLIQTVVEAEYAFVIHTANPSTGNRDELYAEVVLGLGETLVGNYPGRALSFIWDKRTERTHVISLPSKSHGLYGGGLIFRSDSNGEDLAGYAGAGLYDSVLLNPPRQALLDYSDEPLVWDNAFRDGLLRAIAKIGLAVEAALDSPQDIEGAVAKGQYYIVQARPQVGLKSARQ